jgi:hypothetical protein
MARPTVFHGTITHSDGYVTNGPLTIRLTAGETLAELNFVWDHDAAGNKNIQEHFQFPVTKGPDGVMTLRRPSDDTYYWFKGSKGADGTEEKFIGTWYNTSDELCGTWWAVGPGPPPIPAKGACLRTVQNRSNDSEPNQLIITRAVSSAALGGTPKLGTPRHDIPESGTTSELKAGNSYDDRP